MHTERVRHLVQVAIPLLDCLPYPIRRSSVDLLRAQGTLQHLLQNCLHQRVRVHRVPHAERLQTNSRPEPGHIQGAIPIGSERGARDHIPVQVHLLRGM
jgi:hypothetical protein